MNTRRAEPPEAAAGGQVAQGAFAASRRCVRAQAHLGVNSTSGFLWRRLTWRRSKWKYCAGVVAFTTNILALRSALRRIHCSMNFSQLARVTWWVGVGVKAADGGGAVDKRLT
jgi:hypothetical protein